jgi:hypothetical protein
MHGLDLEGEMTGFAIAVLIAELGIAIVGGIEITEEACTFDPVELDKIARYMGTDGILGDATSLELAYLSLQLALGDSILHIALALGSSIATLEPVAIVALARRHGHACMLHDSLELATRAVLYAYR